MSLLEKITPAISRYSEAYNNYNTKKTTMEEQEATFNAEKDDSVEANLEYVKASAEVRALKSRHGMLTAQISSLEANITNLTNLMANLAQDDPMYTQYKNSYDVAVERQERLEKELEDLETDLAEAETSESDAKANVDTETLEKDEAYQAFNTASEEFYGAELEYNSARDELTSYGEAGIKAASVIDEGGDVSKATEAAEEILAETEKAEETEEAKLTNGVSQLTEEEAIEQGYTIIKTADDLAAIANNLNGKYILMNDIDLAGVDWVPLGQGDPFKGKLDGNGYSIKNMNVTADEDDTAVGLFAQTDGAELLNLILENATVNAGDPSVYNKITAGLLIGLARNTNIDNVTVSGNISGYQATGGVIGTIADYSRGDLEMSVLSNIIANVDVESAFYAGGLVGKVNSSDLTSLVIENCHTNGNMTITDQAGGGIIGEANKCVVTVNQCTSGMNISKGDETDTGFFPLDDVSRIGGIIGNCNGTFITVANCEYTGELDCEDPFKSEVYGWYMNDAQVSIYDLSNPLPINDILRIEGIESIQPIGDAGGVPLYEVAVSTLAGMNKIVDMIKANPALADQITFNVLFDFETMDAQYDHTNYSQYGVVQHLYEDENGQVVNEVYIDNEIDVETTFHGNIMTFKPCDLEPIECNIPKPTMVDGLYKKDGKYYVYTPGSTRGEFENFTEVSLQFFFENQKTLVTKRLSEEQVELREMITDVTWTYQEQIQNILRERYGLEEGEPLPIIDEPEYKHLKQKQMNGETLSKEEQLKLDVFELNYTIANIVADATNNHGCGMGGDAPFLQDNCYIDKDGKYVFATTDEETGETTYAYEDGTPYEGAVEELEQAKQDATGQALVDVETQMKELLALYESGGKVDINPNKGEAPEENPEGTEGAEGTEQTGDAPTEGTGEAPVDGDETGEAPTEGTGEAPVDGAETGEAPAQTDTDGDGTSDAQDTDDDNDGIPDEEEQPEA